MVDKSYTDPTYLPTILEPLINEIIELLQPTNPDSKFVLMVKDQDLKILCRTPPNNTMNMGLLKSYITGNKPTHTVGENNPYTVSEKLFDKLLYKKNNYLQ